MSDESLDRDTEKQYQIVAKGRHRATLAAIFADPVRSGIVWTDVEALFRACGADIAKAVVRASGSP